MMYIVLYFKETETIGNGTIPKLTFNFINIAIITGNKKKLFNLLYKLWEFFIWTLSIEILADLVNRKLTIFLLVIFLSYVIYNE